MYNNIYLYPLGPNRQYMLTAYAYGYSAVEDQRCLYSRNLKLILSFTVYVQSQWMTVYLETELLYLLLIFVGIISQFY